MPTSDYGVFVQEKGGEAREKEIRTQCAETMRTSFSLFVHIKESRQPQLVELLPTKATPSPHRLLLCSNNERI